MDKRKNRIKDSQQTEFDFSTFCQPDCIELKNKHWGFKKDFFERLVYSLEKLAVPITYIDVNNCIVRARIDVADIEPLIRTSQELFKITLVKSCDGLVLEGGARVNEPIIITW
jgi:hypothetical protein